MRSRTSVALREAQPLPDALVIQQAFVLSDGLSRMQRDRRRQRPFSGASKGPRAFPSVAPLALWLSYVAPELGLETWRPI